MSELSASGRTKFIRAKYLGDKFDKAAVLATLQANAEHKPKVQFKQDTIGKLIDIQSRMTEGKGIGYKRWLTKHNLKAMAQTVKLLQEKGLTDEDALDQSITELETKYPRFAGGGERPRRSHEIQQRAALSCRSLRQYQECRTAVKDCQSAAICRTSIVQS